MVEQEIVNKLVFEELERILGNQTLLRRIVSKLAPEILTSYKEKTGSSFVDMTTDIQLNGGKYDVSSISKIAKGKRKIPEKPEYDETLQAIVELEGSEQLIKDKTIEIILNRISYDEHSDVYLPRITLEELHPSSLEDSNKGILEWIQNLEPIHSEDLDEKLEDSIQREQKGLLKRVESLKISNINDLHTLQFLKNSLDFYEKYPNADILFNGFFSAQYDLFSQLLEEKIGLNEFSDNLEKLMDIVYTKIVFKIDN